MRSLAALRHRPASFQSQPLSAERCISGLLSRSRSSSRRRCRPPPTLSPPLSVCNGPGEEQEGREINKGTEREIQEGRESRNWRAMEGANKRRREQQWRRRRRHWREMEARSLGRSQAALSVSVAVQSGLPALPPAMKTFTLPRTPSQADHEAALVPWAHVIPSSLTYCKLQRPGLLSLSCTTQQHRCVSETGDVCSAPPGSASGSPSFLRSVWIWLQFDQT